jgi:hypothetical protein
VEVTNQLETRAALCSTSAGYGTWVDPRADLYTLKKSVCPVGNGAPIARSYIR